MSEEGLVKMEAQEEDNAEQHEQNIKNPPEKIKEEILNSREYSKFFRPGLEPIERIKKSSQPPALTSIIPKIGHVTPLHELKNLGSRTYPGDYASQTKIGFLTAHGGNRRETKPRNSAENLEPLSLVIRTKKDAAPKPGKQS